MHVHTKYSDTYTKTKNLIKKAEKLGINFAITDHNEIKGISDALRNKTDVTIISGIEVGCEEGPHLLMYFYNYPELKEFYARNIYKYKSKNPFMSIARPAKDILDAATDYNCVISAAHPDAPPVLGISRAIKKVYVHKELLAQIPAVEVISGMATEKMNLRAIKMGYELKKGFTGGSDCHSLQQFGKVVTCSKSDNTDGLYSDILKHKTHVYGKNVRAGGRIVPHAKTVSKHIRYGSSTIKLRAKSMISKPLKHNVNRIKKKINSRKQR